MWQKAEIYDSKWHDTTTTAGPRDSFDGNVQKQRGPMRLHSNTKNTQRESVEQSICCCCIVGSNSSSGRVVDVIVMLFQWPPNTLRQFKMLMENAFVCRINVNRSSNNENILRKKINNKKIVKAVAVNFGQQQLNDSYGIAYPAIA